MVASAIAMIENEAADAAASLAAIVALAGKTIARCGRSVSHSTVSVSVAAPEKHAGALLGLIAIAFFSSPYSSNVKLDETLVAKHLLNADVGADVGATVGTAVVGAVVGTVVGANVGAAVGADVQRLIVEANGAEVKFPSAMPSCIWLPVATHAVKVMSVADHV